MKSVWIFVPDLTKGLMSLCETSSFRLLIGCSGILTVKTAARFAVYVDVINIVKTHQNPNIDRPENVVGLGSIPVSKICHLFTVDKQHLIRYFLIVKIRITLRIQKYHSFQHC